jgi:serine/threonine-protein kinase
MRVVAVSLSDGRIQDIGLTDVLMAKALPEGYLIYQRRAGGPLLAATFDFKRLRIVGEGRTVSPATRVTYRVVPQWDASGAALVFYPPAPMQLVLVDRSGRTTPLAEDPRTYHHPRFSPDGRLIALDITDQGRDVWMADTRDRRMWRLTVGEVANDPFWSPDGRRVAYTAVRGGVRGVFFRAADGSGTPDSIYMDQNDHSSGAWSPDGSALVVSTAGQSGLWRIPLNGSGAAAAIPGSRASEAYPALSRDGRWLAFVSDESGRQEVYVRPFVGAGGRVQVSVNGGSEPVFTRDGQELIYEEHSETSQLISARIRTAPTFEVLSRTPLFDVTNYANAEDHANYDVSPDGRSFAMIRNAQASQIQLILNWAAQLGRE